MHTITLYLHTSLNISSQMHEVSGQFREPLEQITEYVQTMKIRRFYFLAIVESQSSYSHCTNFFDDNLCYGNMFYKVTFSIMCEGIFSKKL